MKRDSIENRVYKLLDNYEHLRDDDNKLISIIWHQELNGITEAIKFLYAFYDGKFTKPETVRRTRQKLQEVNPHLRGRKYKQRQSHQKIWIAEMDKIQPTKLQETLF